MNYATKQNRLSAIFVFILAFVIFALGLSSCTSSEKQQNYAELEILGAGDHTLGVAKFYGNGDQIVASTVDARVSVHHDDLTVWSKSMKASFVRVILENHGISWSGQIDDPIPAVARPFFTDQQIMDLGLVFDDQPGPTSSRPRVERDALARAAISAATCGAAQPSERCCLCAS